jgi:superfamily I DNA and/or RNA helicase
VTGARVVMCTLTKAYLAPVMAGPRFDVLIAEEAGMTTLLRLFSVECLCRRAAIVVGDPRQLPPIVQSNEDLVRRAIGRGVFDVTIPDPLHSDVVAMLEIQYRMHPRSAILSAGCSMAAGSSTRPTARRPRRSPPARRFRACQLRSSIPEAARAASAPKGSSRINPGSAEITADLALEAIRGGATSVAVITPYAAQAAEVRRLLAERAIGDVVECSTVHRFLGRECDVVLIDLVDAPAAAAERPGDRRAEPAER